MSHIKQNSYLPALSIPFEFLPTNYLNQFKSQKCLRTLPHRLKKRSNIWRSVRASRGRAGLGRPVAVGVERRMSWRGNVWVGAAMAIPSLVTSITRGPSLSIPDRILCSLFLFHSCGDESEPDEVWRHRPSMTRTADDFPFQSYLFGFDSFLHGYRLVSSIARWGVNQKWRQEFCFSDSMWRGGERWGISFRRTTWDPKNQIIGREPLPKRIKSLCIHIANKLIMMQEVEKNFFCQNWRKIATSKAQIFIYRST